MASAATKLSPVARKSPPGPSSLVFLGVWPGIARDWLGFLERGIRQYGPVFAFKFFTIPFCYVSEPALIEEILVSGLGEYEKSLDYQILKRMTGNGLLVSEGEFWRRQRRLAQPAFHRERIEAYARIMTQYTERRLATWRDGDRRDAHIEMMSLTLEIVAKALFGMDVTHEAQDFGAILDVFMKEFLNFSLYILPEWLPLPANWRVQRATRRLDNIVYGIISERRRRGEDTGDLLSMLLAARDDDGKGMSDAQLRSELVTLLMAGHETTANLLAWAFYLLSGNPEVEERLRTEWDLVLEGRAPAAADLRRMPYTEKVVKESLRLYPPAWGVGRRALKDVCLGEYWLPAGTNFLLPQWTVHRDARFFAEPERFLPERWTPEMEKALPRFAYFPFGGGPRVCIGAAFAQMEAQILLATIGQKWSLRLLPDPPVELLASITLRPKHGIPVRLEKR